MNSNKKTKILYVWKGNYPWEIRIKKFCHAFVNAGYEVFLLARNTGEHAQTEVVENTNVFRVGKQASICTLPIPKNPVWHNAIKNAIKKIKPDLIIVREIMLAETTALLGKKYSIPVIMDMAENYPACMRIWKKYNSNALSRWLMHDLHLPDFIEKRCVHLCTGVIVVCEEQIERLQQYKLGADNISVVYNTPVFDDFVGITPSVVDIGNKIRHNIPIRFCNHGFLTAEKPLHNFLHGFESVADKYNIQFVIAGDGESLPDYKQLVENFKHKDKIMFIGRYDYESLASIINDMDIGVLPFPADAQNNYTVQNKIFDYMFAGKPVLTGNSQPSVRILHETNAGLALDFSTSTASASAIEAMLLSDTNVMSQNGMEAVKNKYNWGHDSQTLINFVEKYIK